MHSASKLPTEWDPTGSDEDLPRFIDEAGNPRSTTTSRTMTGVEPKPSGRGWQTGESMAPDAMARETRVKDMEAFRQLWKIDRDLTEIYSPARVNTLLKKMRMIPGYSLDLTTPGPNGRYLDFSRAADRTKLRRLVRERRPYVIIGSPPCTADSQLHSLHKYHPGGEERLRRLREAADKHSQFCCEVYAYQARCGFCFVHARPENAASWQVPCMVTLMRTPGVLASANDQCSYGLTSKDEAGVGPMKKPNRVVTNSAGVSRGMQRRCRGCKMRVQLMGGRAAGAARYPKGCCEAPARGIGNHMQMDQQGLRMVDVKGDLSCAELQDLNGMRVQDDANNWRHWDDVSGKELSGQEGGDRGGAQDGCLDQGAESSMPGSHRQAAGRYPLGGHE